MLLGVAHLFRSLLVSEWSNLETMKDLPLNALRAFAVIYETGGIRPAARSLRVTHSSISRHVRELESWIGLSLIEVPEGTRSLRFTDQGEALGRSALAGLRELETACQLHDLSRGSEDVALAGVNGCVGGQTQNCP